MFSFIYIMVVFLFVILSASEESSAIDESPPFLSRVNVDRRRFFARAQNDKYVNFIWSGNEERFLS